MVLYIHKILSELFKAIMDISNPSFPFAFFLVGVLFRLFSSTLGTFEQSSAVVFNKCHLGKYFHDDQGPNQIK
jgi:hypothetical protein